MPSFLVGLCVSYIFDGLMVQLVSSASVPIPYALYDCDDFSFKFPLLLAATFVVWILSSRTKFGDNVRMIGSQEQAAIFTGIDVNRAKILAFMICGVCCVIAAFLTAARSGAASVKSGSGMMFNTLIALVMGGFPMNGGAKSRITAPIIGSLMLQVLTNGLAILNVSTTAQGAVKGAIFAGIIAIMALEGKLPQLFSAKKIHKTSAV